MKYLSKENIKNYLNFEELLYQKSKELVSEMIESGEYKIGNRWSVDNVEFSNNLDKTYITIYETWAYGGFDYDTITTSTHRLFDKGVVREERLNELLK